MRVLVTGANGFVGRVLVPELASRDYLPVPAVRNAGTLPGAFAVGEIGPDTDWREALAGVDAVVHLAGRAHVMKETSARAMDLYRRTNVAGSLRLAQAARQAGVRRLVFVSSIKVNGEQTHARSFRASDTPAPLDDYGRSKHEAELALQRLAADGAMELVVIRPPLVYGPGVKGNFARLARLVRAGVPLPLGAIDNRRSLVSVYNLCDLICRCLQAPAPAQQVLLVSDGEDLSTTDLLRRLGRSMGRPARLVPVPQALLRLALKSLGRTGEYQRLCGSLQVSIEDTRRLLDWTPPLSVDAGLGRVSLS